MEFTPAHAHPFSVAEAALLDVNTIVGEITRLDNSLAHLSASQDELRAFLADDEDADLRAAHAENEGVIAAQSERIRMLRHVLVSKVGEASLAHYGIDAGVRARAPELAPTGTTDGTAANTAAAASAVAAPPASDADDGLHL